MAETNGTKTLLQRLNAVMKEVDYVQKEKKQGMRYSVVSHDDVTAKVRPPLVEHGVLYYPQTIDMRQVGNRTEIQMTVRFINTDDRNDYLDVITAGYGIDDQDKGPGKAISYCVKYALLKCLGIETGDDPDLDQDVTFKDDDREFPVGDWAAGRSAAPSKSSAELKRQTKTQWEDEFKRELYECVNLPQLERHRINWKKIADNEGWNTSFRHMAQELIAQQKDHILSQMSPEALADLPLQVTLQSSLRQTRKDDDTFPGDR